MIREIAKSIREYKKVSILTPIFVSLEVVIECIIPFLTAEMVNRIKGGHEISEITLYGIMLIVLAGLSLAFGALAGSTCATASCGLAKNLRRDMFHKVQDYAFENIDRFSTSSLVTRLTTDVTNVQNAYMMIIRIAIRCPLMLIFAFVMAFVMGGKMAFIFLFVVPVLGLGLFAVIRKAMPLFRRVCKKYDALNSSIQENVKGIRVVKSYVREDFEQQKFTAAAADVAGENPCAQYADDAVLPVHGDGVRTLLRLVYHHHHARSGPGRRPVFGAADIQLYDSQQPDDGFDDFRDDHYGQRVRQAHLRGPDRAERAHRPRRPGI